MSTDERNEHFKGFAKLLWDDLAILFSERMLGVWDEIEFQQAIRHLIAQHAYDLVYFLLDKAPYHSGSFDTGYGTPGEIAETIEHLPDLTEWPTMVD